MVALPVTPLSSHAANGDLVRSVGNQKAIIGDSWVVLTIIKDARMESGSIVPDCNCILSPFPADLIFVGLCNSPVQQVSQMIETLGAEPTLVEERQGCFEKKIRADQDCGRRSSRSD